MIIYVKVGADLVGYVYSFDFEKGYNYLLIKAYDAIDLDFIDEDTPCDTYRVDRSDRSYALAKPRDLSHALTLRQIKDISALVIEAEAVDDYPKRISWEIIAGGRVNERGAEDETDIWYVPTEMLDSNSVYINISELCFSNRASNLKASFFANAIRQVCLAGGICADDTFAECGVQIYCTSYMAHYEKELFGTSLLKGRLDRNIRLPKMKFKIRRADILDSLAKIPKITSANQSTPVSYVNEAQRKAGIAFASILKDAIDGEKGAVWLFREMRTVLDEAYLVLLEIHEEFKRRTGLGIADMEYLSLAELHKIFTYAENAADAPRLVRKKRQRGARLNKMDAPMVLYKGNLYYKENM